MHTLRTPRLNLLIAIFFLATFCFTCFETTIGLLVMRNFHIAQEKDDMAELRQILGKVGWLIAYCGFIGAMVQGGMLKRLNARLGEPKLIAASLFFAAVGLAAMPYITTSWGVLLIFLAIFSVGSAMTRPPVFGMISLMTAAHEQGAVLGVAQGVGSLARIVGPMFALSLFPIDPQIPYVSCAVLCFLVGCVSMFRLTRHGVVAGAPVKEASPSVS